MTEADGLAAFLLAQYDADERRENGKYTISGLIQCPECWNTSWRSDSIDNEATFDPCGHTLPWDEFVKRFGRPNPDEFRLAEIAAKRKIVEWHTNKHDLLDSAHPTMGCRCYGGWPCPTLRLLVLPYASRDGYQETWRP